MKTQLPNHTLLYIDRDGGCSIVQCDLIEHILKLLRGELIIFNARLSCIAHRFGITILMRNKKQKNYDRSKSTQSQ